MQNRDIAKMYVNDIKTTTLVVASNLLYDGMIIPWYSTGPNLVDVTPIFVELVAEYGYINGPKSSQVWDWSLKTVEWIYMDFFVEQKDLYEFVWIPPPCIYVYILLWIHMDLFVLKGFHIIALSALWYLGSPYTRQSGWRFSWCKRPGKHCRLGCHPPTQ